MEATLNNWENSLYRFIRINLEKVPVNNTFLNQTLISCEEIYANILEHAYTTEKLGKVEILFESDKKNIKITFIDEGATFNPLSFSRIKLNLNTSERKTGGWGISIVKKFMDKVEYEYKNKKNFLIITKFLKEGGKQDGS